MRTILIIIVLGIIMTLYGLINFYIGLKGWNGLGRLVPFLSPRIFWLFFWLLALSYPAAQIFERLWPGLASRWLMLVGAYWTAAMFYFILILVPLDLVIRIGKGLKFLPAAVRESVWAAPAAGILIVAAVAIILVYGTWNAMHPQVSRYEVNIDKKAGSVARMRIILVSDIHLGSIVRTGRLDKLARMINQCRPDLVILAGDIVDQTIEPDEAARLVDIFSGIKTTYGIYAVPGNHEYISGFVEKTASYLAQAGVLYLRDATEKVADSFYIVGRDDSAGARFQGTARQKLPNLLDGLNSSLPLILVDHQPVETEEARSLGVDLQLGGHTHRGQLWPNNFITNRIFENDWGLLTKGAYHLIVSSGFGTWGPPIRTGSPSEVVEIDVHFKDPTEIR